MYLKDRAAVGAGVVRTTVIGVGENSVGIGTGEWSGVRRRRARCRGASRARRPRSRH